MIKIRVHELAKELGMGNRELLELLARKNISVTSHMSSLDDDVACDIRRAVKKSAAAKAAPDSQPEDKKSESAPPVKGKNIVRIFRPQNAINSARFENSPRRAPVQRGARPMPTDRRVPPSQRPMPGAVRPGQRRPMPMDRRMPPSQRPTQGAPLQPERPVRPIAEAEKPLVRPAAEIERPVRPVTEPERPVRPATQPERPVRPSAETEKPLVKPAIETERPVKPATQPEKPIVKPAAEIERPVKPAAEIEKPLVKPATQPERPIRPASPERPAATERPTRPEAVRERFARLSSDGERRARPASSDRPSRPLRSAFSSSDRPARQRTFGQQGQRTDDAQGRPRYPKPDFAQPKDGAHDRRAFDFKRRDIRGGAADTRTGRPEEKRDVRYEDRKDRDFRRVRDDKRGREVTEVSAGQMAEQQKAQRNKAKEKEKDFRDKEYKKDIEFEGRGKRRRKEKAVPEMQKPQAKGAEKKEEQIKLIVLPETITLKELADKMKIVPSAIIKKLFLTGKAMTVNDEIDYDEAEEIALGFDILCEKEKQVDVIEELLKEDEEDENKMKKRPPVVCVMGHVDHGKTSLLDAIRHTNVTGREAGGITQHIGAYVTQVNGESITFLDTPGHEAFTSMRMRGANSTDIAVLVVAADDGVMPQTIEAISHAKAAGTEIIVAINKIDKPGANVERVKQELADKELIPEDWGGHTICVPVSAYTKEGIPELLDMILLTAEMMELKANPDRAARGLVIEAKLDKGKGSVATVLVQKGTLHVGDAVAAGSAHGKVRAMMDEKGRRVKEAGPSKPVEILGLNDVPNAGDVFVSCESEKEARSFAETFISQGKAKLIKDTKSKMSLDDLFTQIKEGDLKELDIVVKADVQGSVEALKQSLERLSNEEVVVKVIHGGVGAINESDVILASASDAVIIGFNVRPDATAKEIAKSEGVDLRLYKVIYNAIDDVEAAMKGMLEPVYEEKILGHAQVRRTFKASGVGTIAGAYILDGVFERTCKVRLTRDGAVMFDGPLASLKRYKDDVKEVKAGYECGVVFENYNDIEENDLVEAYKMVEAER